MMRDDASSSRRWPRSEKFILSPQGLAIEARYRKDIVTARGLGGRRAYDAARSAWSESYSLQPDDGMYLGEMRRRAITLAEIVRSVEVCGQTRKQAEATIVRLLDRGLVSPVQPGEP